MNKILMDRDKKELMLEKHYEFKEDGNYFLEIENIDKEVCLVVLENVNVTINLLGNKTNINFYIRVNRNSSLIINNFIIDGSININTILEDEYASFSLNNSILSSSNSNNKIEVKHLSSKTNSYLKNHGFSQNQANIIFDVSSFVPKESNSCTCKQDNKIIQNETSLSQINPKLYIDNYDIEASHSAYVGEFKEEELFYMMSRGISIEDAKFLLLKSFLVGSMPLNNDIMEKFYNSVIKYFNKEV